MNAKISIVKITPAMAQEYLNNMLEDQRKFRSFYSDRLALEMVEGRWKLSPDAITLVKGKLANGQHRLWAVVRSKKTCQFLLLETDDEEIYRIMDAGAKRTVADVCQTLYSNTVSAAASWVMKYDQQNLSARGGKSTAVIRGRQIQYVQDHQDSLVQAAKIVESLCASRNTVRIVPASMGTAFLELAWRYSRNAEQPVEFITRLYKGTDCDEYPGSCHTAIKQLHQRLLKEKTTRAINKDKMPVFYVFALMVKAYNAFVRNQTVIVLKLVAGEAYPRLHGQPADEQDAA